MNEVNTMRLNVIYPKAFADEGLVNLSAVQPQSKSAENDHIAAEIELSDGSYFVGLNGEHKIGVFPSEPRPTSGHVFSRLDIQNDTVTVHNFGGTKLGEQDLGPGESVTLNRGDAITFRHKGQTSWSVQRAD